MSTLDTAAADASEKLAAFLLNSESAFDQLSATETRFVEENTNLQAQWATAEATAQATLARVTTTRQEQETAYLEAIQTLQELTQQISAIQAQVDEQSSLSIQQLAQVETLLESKGAEVDTVLSTVEEGVVELKQELVQAETELESALASAVNVQEEANQAIGEYASVLTSRTQETAEFLATECTDKLNSKIEEYTANLTDAVSNLEAEFQQLGEEADSKIEAVMTHATEDQGALITQLDEDAGMAETSIKTTGEAVSRLGETFEASHKTMNKGVKLTNTGFDTAVGALKEIQRILDRFPG